MRHHVKLKDPVARRRIRRGQEGRWVREEARLTCFIHSHTIFALGFTSHEHFVLNIKGEENI